MRPMRARVYTMSAMVGLCVIYTGLTGWMCGWRVQDGLSAIGQAVAAAWQSGDNSAGATLSGIVAPPQVKTGIPLGARTSDADLPAGEMQQVLAALRSLAGLDDLVVSADPAGVGYDVDATIELGHAGQPSLSVRISQDVDQFFGALYGAGIGIRDAQVYFTEEGRLIGGAGLGQTDFTRLAAAASSGSGDLAAQLSHVSAVTGEGSADAWFEVNACLAGQPCKPA